MVNRDVAGFVTTRLICALAMEAIRLVESGVASAEDIDTACRLGFGHPMGPLATIDLTGVDILRHATLNIYEETADEKFFPPEIADPDGRRRRPGPQVRPGLLLLRLTTRRPAPPRDGAPETLTGPPAAARSPSRVLTITGHLSHIGHEVDSVAAPDSVGSAS